MFSIGVKYFWSSVQRGRLKNVLRLTILSLSINIGVFIAGLALIRGFQGETLNRMLHMYGHAQITPMRKFEDLDIKLPEPEYWLFKSAPQIKSTFQYLEKWIKVFHNPVRLEKVIEKYEMPGGVSKNGVTDGILVTGVSETDASYLLEQQIKDGSVTFATKDGREGVIIGHRMAKRFRIWVGDTIDLLLKTNSELDSIPMRVTGIFDFGFYEFDSSLVFVRSKLLNEYKARSIGVLYTNNPQEIETYAQALQTSDPSIDVLTWKERNRMMQDMFNSQIRAISLIMGLFILSAIIQSITSLFVLLSERSYDLSVLTTLGMSSYQKYSMFAAYGLLISLSNTFFGVLSGIGLVLLYPHFKHVFENLTGHKIIHSEAFWLSDFNPSLVATDILMVTLVTLFVMSISMLIAAHFTSRVDVMSGIKD